MKKVILRPMTPPEFALFRTKLVREYAAANVEAGRWSAEEGMAESEIQTRLLLPLGLDSARVLLMIAENEEGEGVGHLWIGLDRHGGAGAWIYDIEVSEGHRGQGYGRGILQGAEQETLRNGVATLGLNVFGRNTVARALYESSGYEITSQQMQKELKASD